MIVYKNYKGSKKGTFAISISKGIKDFFEKYQFNNAYPEKSNDKRFKNISTLMSYILENCMEILLSGKTLDDFKNFIAEPDNQVKDFYKKLTVRVFPEQYNEQIVSHRYFNTGNNIQQSFLFFRDFLIKSNFYVNYSIKEILNTLNRFKNYVLNNKLTKTFEAFTDNDLIIIEYRGLYSNIHYEFSKNIIALMGFIGLQIQEIIIQEKYCRFEFIITPLLKSKKLNFKDRRILSSENEKKLFDSMEILDEESFHLWMRLSKNDNCIISFLDYNSGKNFILNKIETIKKTIKEKRKKKNNIMNEYLLKLFNKFNWITILEMDSHSFRINVSKTNHNNEFILLSEFINSMGNIVKIEDYLTLQ